MKFLAGIDFSKLKSIKFNLITLNHTDNRKIIITNSKNTPKNPTKTLKEKN